MERPGPDVSSTASFAAPRLARSAGLIGLATATSRVLGLVRDSVLAHFFGAGDAMDAFNVAFRVPNLLRDLFAEGAMTAAFVPTFTRYLTLRGREEAWRLGNLVVNALAGVTILLAVLGMIFAEPLVTLFASKYAGVPGKLALTVSLARVMFPFLTLVALAAACMGMLNSLRRFFVPALSPAMFNVGTIITVLPLVPLLRAWGYPAIYAVAVGTLVGGALQVLVQWPLLHREGYRYRPAVDIRHDGLRQVLALMGPGTVGLAAVQVNVLVNTILATDPRLGHAVSWLNYAFRLMYLPIGLFGVSIATAALPSISALAATDDRPGMRRTVSSALRLMLMLNVPATVGLIVLAAPIIGLLFEHGSFTSADTASTARALVFYAPGLIGYSAVKIAAPTFYALHESRTPVIVSVASVGLNLGLNLVLVRVMGYRGLALGTALAAIFNASSLLFILRRRLGGIDGRRVAVATLKVLLASVAMGIASWAADAWLTGQFGRPSVVTRLASVCGSIAAGLVVLAAAARALRIAEFNEAVAVVWGRLTGRKVSR
ncbi:MAG: murein biosynthesis integral membrane protein MurJ [Acidobacteria bacterium]|nr:MAG: murein biosynthesis integral membrane protein MurJ [Acidobacteriota bacterium]